MFNVLIVDDEPAIRQGLRTLIPWENYGFRVTDVAANGRKALEKYRDTLFQLVIVDIRMPGMDGLQLVEALRNQDESVHILIISGYADFKYAKKAMAWHVDGYILKPVDEDELIPYLEQLKARLIRESQITELTAGENTRRCERLIQSILSEKVPDEAGSYEMASSYGLLSDRYQILLIKLEGTRDRETSFTAAVKQELMKVFDKRKRGVVFSKGACIGVLLKGAFQPSGDLTCMDKELANVIRDNEIDYYAAVGVEVAEITDIGRSYDTALKLVNRRFFFGSGKILDSTSSPVFTNADQPRPYKFSGMNAADQLFYAVDVKNKETVECLVSEYGLSMAEKDCSEQSIKSSFIKLVTTVLNKLSRSDSNRQSIASEYSTRMIEVYKQPDLVRLLDYVKSLLFDVVDSLDDNVDGQIKRMVDLIQRDYCENLKLETLAAVFNYNSAYLGKLFKNYTGEYFNTYLDKVRIDKAKEFLIQDMKVYQVASRVGYNNSDYFYSKFKKYVGMSPSVYRKNHSELKP